MTTIVLSCEIKQQSMSDNLDSPREDGLRQQAVVGAPDKTLSVAQALAIGVPNGVIGKGEAAYDSAEIMIKNVHTAEVVYCETERVTIPPNVWSDFCKDQGSVTPVYKTVGEVFRHLYGYDASDWHGKISGSSRATICANTIFNLLQNPEFRKL